MDRAKVYPGQEVLDVDVLRTNKFAMVGLGWLFQGLYGTTDAVDGLACTPGTGLHVLLDVGQVYQQQATDATAYGSLGIDNKSLMKQGLLLAASDPISVPAPVTPGFSINYLIEVQVQQVDGGSAVLPYYNAANPTIPFSGPGGAGTPNYVERDDIVAYQAKAGTPAATGTQTTPTADAGWVGIWVVTIAYGATSVVVGNITAASPSAFISPKLGGIAAYVAAQIAATASPGGALFVWQVQGVGT